MVSVVPPPYAFVVVTIIIAFDKISDRHAFPVKKAVAGVTDPKQL